MRVPELDRTLISHYPLLDGTSVRQEIAARMDAVGVRYPADEVPVLALRAGYAAVKVAQGVSEDDVTSHVSETGLGILHELQDGKSVAGMLITNRFGLRRPIVEVFRVGDVEGGVRFMFNADKPQVPEVQFSGDDPNTHPRVFSLDTRRGSQIWTPQKISTSGVKLEDLTLLPDATSSRLYLTRILSGHGDRCSFAGLILGTHAVSDVIKQLPKIVSTTRLVSARIMGQLFETGYFDNRTPGCSTQLTQDVRGVLYNLMLGTLVDDTSEHGGIVRSLTPIMTHPDVSRMYDREKIATLALSLTGWPGRNKTDGARTETELAMILDTVFLDCLAAVGISDAEAKHQLNAIRTTDEYAEMIAKITFIARANGQIAEEDSSSEPATPNLLEMMASRKPR